MSDAARDKANPFEKAAPSYDAAAVWQKDVARHLVSLARHDHPQTILDIGCGTGFVLAAARGRWPSARLFGLDSSPAMLEEARRKLPGLAAMEGDAARLGEAEAPFPLLREGIKEWGSVEGPRGPEGSVGSTKKTLAPLMTRETLFVTLHPSPSPSQGEGGLSSPRFDLMFSSMLLHWLPEPARVLRNWTKLLKPGGRLYAALPVAGTLREWRGLCRSAGAGDRLINFPPEDFAQGVAGTLELREHKSEFPGLAAFLQSLRNAGAHAPRPGSSPLPRAAMRSLLRGNENGFTATWRVVYLEVKSEQA